MGTRKNDPERETVIRLSHEDAERVFGQVENPPEANAHLKAAFKRNRELLSMVTATGLSAEAGKGSLGGVSRTTCNGVAMDEEARTASAFNPIMHGFVFLTDHCPPWGVKYYEYRNHPCVDGNHDFYRLNIYLTQDGQFVNIWFGALEEMVIVAFLEKHGVAPVDYNESLFRGYVSSMEQARHILKALRTEDVIPQRLRTGPDGKIVCDGLEELEVLIAPPSS